MEEWRPYRLNPMYLVSNYGKVKSLYKSQRLGDSGNLLSAKPDNNGYPRVSLIVPDPGKYDNRKLCYLHRLVAQTFIENPNNLPEVNHIDGNKLNSHVDNLEWVTHQENIQKAWDNGQCKRISGEDHWKYGTKTSEATKKLQSISKLGKLHPKYTGYYLIGGVRYFSSTQAAEAIGKHQRTILRWCKNPKIKGYEFIPDPERIG